MSSEKRFPRIFFGPVDVAGYAARLKKGLDEIGVRSTYINLGPNPLLFSDPRSRHGLIHWLFEVRRKRGQVPRGDLFHRALWALWYELSYFLFVAWAVLHHDVFIFVFASSFYKLRDLPLLGAIGKKVVSAFLGSDARPPFMDGALYANPSDFSPSGCIRLTKRKKENIRWIESHSTCVISYPLYSHFLEKPFVSNAFLGNPQPPATAPSTAPPAHRTVRILHAPSDSAAKGTELIRVAIRSIEGAGIPIEYVEVSGATNAEVCRELEACDFVVDQAFSDCPMAGVASEAGRYGKPAIVGTYGLDHFQSVYPTELMPPSYGCAPHRLGEAVRTLALDRATRESMGLRAYKFIGNQWASANVARRLLKIVRGDAPLEWYFDPRTLRYVHGFGLGEDRIKVMIGSMLKEAGRSCLQLTDKPELESALVEFACPK